MFWLLRQYSSQPRNTQMGLIDCWCHCILSWLSCFTGEPLLLVKSFFLHWSHSREGSSHFLLGGGLRPGCLHCGNCSRKEGWWDSECVLNPFIYFRYGSVPSSSPVSDVFFAGPSVVLSWEIKLPVLCMDWREALGSLGGGMGSPLATWSTEGDLGISLLLKQTCTNPSLVWPSPPTYRGTWCCQFLLGVLQGKLGFSWVFPLSA